MTAGAPGAASAPLLRVESLSITHRDAPHPTPADASFAVGPGEALLVLGPSGCGKSTLALALNGLIPHEMWARVDGRVHLGGDDVAGMRVAEAAARVSMVFQDPDAQIVTASLLDEVAFGAENLCVEAAEIDRRVEDALRRVGLWERREESPDRLSGGGRQRLAIAAALAQGAPLMVLDEPTANLDPRGAREVYDVLAELLREARIGVVLVEHNLDDALRIATRVLVLDQEGRTVCAGTPHEVFVERADALERLGVWQPVATVAAAALRRAGWPIGAPLTIDGLRAELEALERGAGGAGGADGADGATAVAAGAGDAASPGPVVSARPSVRSAASAAPAPSPASAPLPPASARVGERAQPHPASPGPLPHDPADAHLVADGLTVRRGGRTLLDGVDLRIGRGEFVAVAGPNGAGKTTLLQALAGISPPCRGTVAVDGRDLARLRVRELRDRIGYVFQNPEHQFLATTVRDELALELRNQGFAGDAIDARVAASLERFGLAALAELHPFLLSGGQKRRLSVATALVSGASCLVLDEPTFGQDRDRAAELVRMLTELNDAGTTVVMATHDLQLAAEVADRCLVVADARIAADDVTGRVLASGVLDAVGIGQPPLVRLFSGLADPRLRGITRMREVPGAPDGPALPTGAIPIVPAAQDDEDGR